MKLLPYNSLSRPPCHLILYYYELFSSLNHASQNVKYEQNSFSTTLTAHFSNKKYGVN